MIRWTDYKEFSKEDIVRTQKSITTLFKTHENYWNVNDITVGVKLLPPPPRFDMFKKFSWNHGGVNPKANPRFYLFVIHS